MKFDSDEKIIFKLNPDRKILIPWFFAKTTTYSFAILFAVFMLVFVANTINEINLASNESPEDSVIGSKTTEENESIEEDDVYQMEHPFKIFVEYWGWAVILTILSMIIIQIYFVYLRKTYRYMITNKRCIFIGGILKRTERSVPYKKITDIQRTQNILERALGIWNIQIFTPGTASMAVGQRKAQAELNFDGLLNSEKALAAINICMQESN